ncbi:hypothetical protein J6T66_06010 [bacterium]|nr:hypothetical protein [bacterium]
MQDLTHMFTYSRVVVELKKLNEWDDSKPFEDNLQSYKTKFFSEFPAEKVQQFENLRETDPSLFLEIITTVSEKSFIY